MGAAIAYFQNDDFQKDDPEIVKLNRDVFEIIISHMTVSDIFQNAMLVSKAWQEIAKENSIWLPRYLGLEKDAGFMQIVNSDKITVLKWNENRRRRRELDDYARGETFMLFNELWNSTYHVWINADNRVYDCKSYSEKYAWISIIGNEVKISGNVSAIVVNVRHAKRQDAPSDTFLFFENHITYSNNDQSIRYKPVIDFFVDADGKFQLVASFATRDADDVILFVTANFKQSEQVYRLKRNGDNRGDHSIEPLMWRHYADANSVIQCQVCDNAPVAYVNTQNLKSVCEECSKY
jgi:hypothetical protein